MTAYDDCRLAGPNEPHEIGAEDGQLCNRYPEPDEDQPRGYRPKPCPGEIVIEGGVLICDTCGEIAQ